MANTAGRSALSTSAARADSRIIHVPQSLPTATDANRSLTHTTLLVHQHCCSTQRAGTFTAISEFDRHYGSTPPWQLPRFAICPCFLQHHSAQFPHARSQPILALHHLECHHCPGPPPRRRLPSLPIPHDNVENWEYRLANAESDDGSSDTEVVQALSELPFGGMQGFPYCMGTSDAMEQRSRTLATAEELTCRKTRMSKHGMRLRGWIRSALIGASADETSSRYRSCLR